MVAKIFVAAVAAYRAYEQLAGCSEIEVAAVGVGRVKCGADANKHIARSRECCMAVLAHLGLRERAVSVSVSLGWQSNITLQPQMTPGVGTCCLISSYRC